MPFILGDDSPCIGIVVFVLFWLKDQPRNANASNTNAPNAGASFA